MKSLLRSKLAFGGALPVGPPAASASRSQQALRQAPSMPRDVSAARQKNEGVYFDYEPVDPDESKAFEELKGEARK